MRKVIYLLLFAVVGLVTACSDDDSGESPDKELGMVMLQADGNARVLLLEGGTLANPISGIDDFGLLRVGKKLLLSYEVVDTEDGVANIRVTEFASADDSTFTVVSAGDAIFSSSFTGSFYIANADSTEIHYGDASFAFGTEVNAGSEIDYLIEPIGSDNISGETTFTLDGSRIIFFDESENILVPQKGYEYSLWEDMLYLWEVREDGTFLSYALRRVD